MVKIQARYITTKICAGGTHSFLEEDRVFGEVVRTE